MRLERAKPADARECIEWLTANREQNDLSPRTLKGAIFYKIQDVFYLPVKLVLMLDSLGPNPRASNFMKGRALIQAVKDLKKMYPSTELVFLSRKRGVMEHAAQKLCGFEPSGYVLYRLHPDAGPAESPNKESLAETRLRNDIRADRRKNRKAKRLVSDLQPVA